jgi:hypothetical protein
MKSLMTRGMKGALVCAPTLVLALVVACGGSVESGSGTGGTGGAGSPAKHRAAGEVCDHQRPPGDECAGDCYEGAECTDDADCGAGENGRCESFRGSRQCTVDECFSDGDCAPGTLCGCESAFWSDANTCMPGNCRTDADCGSRGFCSPSFGDCGAYSGVVGYYCHTAQDECTNDEDCIDPSAGAGYCMYGPVAGRWVCGYGQCVG